MKKIFKVVLFSFVLLLISITNTIYAETTDVNLTIRSGSTIIFSGAIPLPPAGTVELNTHPLDADSVLSIINNADILSSDFNISDLQYFDSFSSFYLKCITSSTGNDCDNWQYTVNDTYPGIGMDKKILSGGESVYAYFGPQNKILLSSNNINTNGSVTVITQKYDYNNNQWAIRTGITVGITQTNPDDPWSPIEIMTGIANESGQTTFSTIPEGSYNIGIKEDGYFPTEALTVTNPPIARGGGGGILTTIVPTPIIKVKFDLQKAFEFIISQQKGDGSFGEDLYTDWMALSFATTTDFQNQKSKLIEYLEKLKVNDYKLTDYERHTMALMALGLNPYNTNGENYIKKITDSFDGKQFGDINEDNDDIFALIVLQNAGFLPEEKIITNDLAFILSRQKENGSWDESVDMTGAAIQALSIFSPKPGLGESLVKAREFLKQNQKDTGGWNNVSSTAWAIGGILALSEKPEEWVKNNNTPLDYLAVNQDTDGGIKNEYLQNRIWETAYVVTALSSKTWNQIIQKFEKPEETPVLQKIEEKTPKQIVKKTITQKKEVIKNQEKENKDRESENLASQNTATVINSLEKSNTENPKRNWFMRFLGRIFGF